MKRVIVKCHLLNRFDLLQRLAEIELNFGATYWQHDRVYVPRNYQKHSNFPRLTLRTEVRQANQPAKYNLILHRHIEDSGVDIVESTPIVDYSAAANILLQLGFAPHSEFSRQRRELSFDQNTQFYLDIIENLPNEYVKIETTLEKNEKVSVVRQDLVDTLSTLGQDPKNIISESYADLL
jgi:adenylate cyclase class IV